MPLHRAARRAVCRLIEDLPEELHITPNVKLLDKLSSDATMGFHHPEWLEEPPGHIGARTFDLTRDARD